MFKILILYDFKKKKKQKKNNRRWRVQPPLKQWRREKACAHIHLAGHIFVEMFI